MCFDHRADGSFVFHPDRRTRTDEEEIASTFADDAAACQAEVAQTALRGKGWEIQERR